MVMLLTQLLARAVNGIGTGILNAIIPVWATETSVCCVLLLSIHPMLTVARNTHREASLLPLNLP